MCSSTLLEDVEGWVLKYLEEDLSENDSWRKLATVAANSSGHSLFGLREINQLKCQPSPASALIKQLVQRGVTIGALLNLLSAAKLEHLHAMLAPKEKAVILKQSAIGAMPIPVGGKLTISVDTRGNPPPQFLWYCGNTPLPQYTESLLVISPFGPENEGIYLCLIRQKVINEEGSDNDCASFFDQWSQPVCASVQRSAPVISLHPCDCQVKWGQKAVLRCSAAAHPAPVFSWYKDGVNIVSSNKPTLELTEVDQCSAGRYWCIVTNNEGQDISRCANVEVQGYGKEEDILSFVRQPCFPAATSTAGRAVLGRGQAFPLWCSVRCSAPVLFTWFCNGCPLSDKGGPYHSVLNGPQDAEATVPECSGGSVQNSCLLYTPSDADASVLHLFCLVTSPTAKVASHEVLIYLKELSQAPVRFTAGRKWALLVGNRRYSGKPLHTTLLDCQRIAAVLHTIGFRCLVLADLTLTQFRNAVNFFASFVQTGDYVMFYYGGHGFHSNGDHLMPVQELKMECRVEEQEQLVKDCLSPVWIRNSLLVKQPELLFLVLDMCRSTLPRSAAARNYRTPVAPLPVAGRCSVVLHATTVKHAALEAISSTSVLTRHLLSRLQSHAALPLTSLASAVLRDVSGDSSTVREQQFPVLEADLALPRSLTDSSTLPDDDVVPKWERILSCSRNMTAEVKLRGLVKYSQPTSAATFKNDVASEGCSRRSILSESGLFSPTDSLMQARCCTDSNLNAFSSCNPLSSQETATDYSDYLFSKSFKSQKRDLANVSEENLPRCFLSSIIKEEDSNLSANQLNSRPTESLTTTAVTVRASLQPYTGDLSHSVANVVVLKVDARALETLCSGASSKSSSGRPAIFHRTFVTAPGCRILEGIRGECSSEFCIEDLQSLKSSIAVEVIVSLDGFSTTNMCDKSFCEERRDEACHFQSVHFKFGSPGIAQVMLSLNDLSHSPSDDLPEHR